MTVLARLAGWYGRLTFRLGLAALRRMFPDDADEHDLNEALADLARNTPTTEEQ